MINCKIERANLSHSIVSANDCAEEEHIKIYNNLEAKVTECNRKHKRIRDSINQKISYQKEENIRHKNKE